MKLYIGNLPYETTEDELKSLFSEYEIQEVKLIVDRDSGRSKGFGFVEIEAEDDGNKAIKELNGKELNGRTIIVNEARPKRKDDNRRSFDSGNRRRFSGDSRDRR